MQGLRPILGGLRLGHHDNLPGKMEAPRQGRGSPGSDTRGLGETRKTWGITVTLRTGEGMGYPGNPVYRREHGSVPVILYTGEGMGFPVILYVRPGVQRPSTRSVG